MMFESRKLLFWVTAPVVAAMASPLSAATGQVFYGLGTLGGPTSYATAINAAGQVTGYSSLGSSQYSDAFIYNGIPGAGGTMTDIGSLDHMGSVGNAINASGTITGSSLVPGNESDLYAYTGTPINGIGDDISLNAGLYGPATGNGVNSAGTLVGSFELDDPDNSYPSHAFFYANNTFTDLGTLGGVGSYNSSVSNGINSSGEIVGNSTGNDGNQHGFLYTGTPGQNGTMYDLGYLGSPTSYLNYTTAAAINDAGQITGTSVSGSSPHAYLYTGTPGVNGNMIDLGILPGGSSSAGTAINSQGVIVGTANTSTSNSDAVVYVGTVGLDGHWVDLNSWLASVDPTDAANWKLTTATGINDSDIVTGTGIYGGQSQAYILNVSALLNSKLVFNNAGGSGDGTTWDTSQLNFNNGSGLVAYSNGIYVVFSDANNQHYTVKINSAVSPAYTVVNNSAGSYVFNGSGGITGGGGLLKQGTAWLTLNTPNTYTGPTIIQGGKLILGTLSALPSASALTVGAGATLVTPAHGAGAHAPMQLSNPSIAGTIGAWTGTIDLVNNDLIVHNSSFGVINSQLQQGYAGGTWQGSGGIVSSKAAADTTHLTALGLILNETFNNNTIKNVFDNTAVHYGDVLIKYTYYGDADLTGKVNSADYTRIDGAYLNNQDPGNTPLTGWYNGDFNYDGVTNGSDYTLIDNAFNQQGATITAQIAPNVAWTTVQIAAVPEPGSAAMVGLVGMGLLGRKARASDKYPTRGFSS
jgi:probable HAF family extracellular repeat protein/autotransporter-associated beta strand protein